MDIDALGPIINKRTPLRGRGWVKVRWAARKTTFLSMTPVSPPRSSRKGRHLGDFWKRCILSGRKVGDLTLGAGQSRVGIHHHPVGGHETDIRYADEPQNMGEVVCRKVDL